MGERMRSEDGEGGGVNVGLPGSAGGGGGSKGPEGQASRGAIESRPPCLDIPSAGEEGTRAADSCGIGEAQGRGEAENAQLMGARTFAGGGEAEVEAGGEIHARLGREGGRNQNIHGWGGEGLQIVYSGGWLNVVSLCRRDGPVFLEEKRLRTTGLFRRIEVGIYSAVGELVHRRAMVIVGILCYAAEQGSTMSASVAKVWQDFWRRQASMVVSTPPLSTEDKSDVMENIASDTSSNSSSNATKKTASDTSRSDDSSGTSSTINAQKAFFAGKRRRKAKRPSNRVKKTIQSLHEEALKNCRRHLGDGSTGCTCDFDSGARSRRRRCTPNLADARRCNDHLAGCPGQRGGVSLV
eukprot:jgi/Undpi1/3450/HiC_scaffold_16.g06822.m1